MIKLLVYLLIDLHLYEGRNTLIQQCRKVYKVGSHIRIKGVVLIKNFIASDVGTEYMIDPDPYLGKHTITNGQPLEQT